MREVLPVIPAGMSLDEIKAGELAEASRYFSRGKFGESLAAYRSILQRMLLVVVSSESEADEVGPATQALPTELTKKQVKEIVSSCKEYVIGLTLETERRRLVAEEPDNTTRNLELAAYFTHCKLASQHVQLSLRSAMGVFSKAGNHSTAAVFARRLIDSKPSDTKVITQVCPSYAWFCLE
jgi:coatomer protein complex subunit alpha (xenin)